MSSRHQRRGRGVDKKGHSKRAGRFILHWHYMLRCDAYRSMKALPRAVYAELRRRFNGSNNGEILCSIRDLVEELHCAKNSASAALAELQEKGFIKCAQRGSFHRKIANAPKWILTEAEYQGALPTKDFMRWTPSKENAGPRMRTSGPENGTDGQKKDREIFGPVLK